MRKNTLRNNDVYKRKKRPYTVAFLLVALTRLDLKNCEKISRYRQRAASTPDNTPKRPETQSAVYIDQHGEKTKNYVVQPMKKLTRTEINAIIEGYRSGATTRGLAEKYGCHRDTISRQLKKQGVAVTIEKVTDNDITEMVRLYESGLKAEEVGRQFGINKTTALRHLRASGVQMRMRWDY